MKLRWAAVFSLVLLQSCCGGSGPTDSTDPTACSTGLEPGCSPTRFSVDADFIYKDGTRFELKGVVYVPGEPGYLPWELEVVSSLPAEVISRIDTDLAGIKALGANTVRL